MTIKDKLQALRDEWPTATETRRAFILMQVNSLKKAQLWYQDKAQLTLTVEVAKDIFKLPIDKP